MSTFIDNCNTNAITGLLDDFVEYIKNCYKDLIGFDFETALHYIYGYGYKSDTIHLFTTGDVALYNIVLDWRNLHNNSVEIYDTDNDGPYIQTVCISHPEGNIYIRLTVYDNLDQDLHTENGYMVMNPNSTAIALFESDLDIVSINSMHILGTHFPSMNSEIVRKYFTVDIDLHNILSMYVNSELSYSKDLLMDFCKDYFLYNN